MDPIPALVVQSLAAVGGIYLGFKVLSFVRLLLSLFVLPGASVSLLTLQIPFMQPCMNRIDFEAFHVRPKR